MATDNSAGAIFIDLGLDISQLESDFVAANATIQQNLNRLNRERNLIDLRAQVEIGGLDETADAAQILEIRERSLNQQLEIQRDRIQLTRAAFQQLRNTQGATAAATQNMEARLQREQLSLQRLEQQLNSVTTAQENLTNGTNSGGESAESAGLEFGGLDSILDKLPPHAKAAVAGFTALTGAIIAAGTASNDLIKRWRELQKQSYNFNLPVNDMETLARRVKFTGGEIEDLHGFLAGLNDAMTKGEWDDPEAIAMRWAGGNIFDANGKLKKFDEQVEEIYRMYQKAKAAGQEIEFLQMMGGESGVTDAKQILDRWEEAGEDAEKIFDAGLDPEEFHKADRALRLLTEQMGEFKDAFENIVTPFSVGAFEKLFEVFHKGTEILVDNKDSIQRWGFVAIETFSTVADKIKAVKDALSELANPGNEIPNFINDWEGNALWQRWLDQMNSDWENTPFEKYYKPSAIELFGGIGNELFGGILERAQEEQDKYNGKLDEGTKSWADFRREQEKGIESTKEETAATKDATEALSQYNSSREEAVRDEFEQVRLENQHFKHGHDLELAQLDFERYLKLRQLKMAESEKWAVEEWYAEKRKNIQLQLEDELDDLRDEATEEFKTDLEKRNIEIENAKDDWIDAGMEEAEAEKYAQALKAKAIEDLEEEWAAAVLAINGSVLEQKLANIEKEKKAWIDKGIDEERAEELAAQQRIQAIEEDNVNSAEEEKLAQEDLNSLFEDREDTLQEIDDLYEEFGEHAETTAAHVREVWGTELENRLAQIEQERKALIKQGVDAASAAKWAAQARVDAERNAALQILKNQLQAYRIFKKGGYQALKQYELNQLYKQGITPEDLKMTPKQLSDFDFARKAVQNSLMPNFMTDVDKDREYAAKMNNRDLFEKPSISVGMPKNMQDRLSSLDKRLAKLIEEIAKAKEALKSKQGKFIAFEQEDTTPRQMPTLNYSPETGQYTVGSYLPSVKTDAELETLNQENRKLTEEISKARETLKNTNLGSTDDIDADALREGESKMTLPPEMAANLENLSQKSADLVSALNSKTSSIGSSETPTTMTNAPAPNISTSVNIQEAHAWDSAHIQELADKVASQIESKIVGAIGGDSNSY